MTVSNAMTKADWIDTFERHTRALGLFVFHAYVYTYIHRYVRTCDRYVHGACASRTCSNAPMTVSVRVSCHVFPCADRDNMCQGRWFITEFWLGGIWSSEKPFFFNLRILTTVDVFDNYSKYFFFERCIRLSIALFNVETKPINYSSKKRDENKKLGNTKTVQNLPVSLVSWIQRLPINTETVV